MTHQYLLPCPACSKPMRVAVAQAGETVSCECGNAVSVPTLRSLRSLPVADVATKGRPSWTVERGIVFVLGILLILAAGLAVWRIAPRRAQLNIHAPEFQELNFEVQRLTPLQAWVAWVHFRDQKLEYRVTPQFIENRVKYRELSYYLYAAAAGAVVGLALVGCSVFWRT